MTPIGDAPALSQAEIEMIRVQRHHETHVHWTPAESNVDWLNCLGLTL